MKKKIIGIVICSILAITIIVLMVCNYTGALAATPRNNIIPPDITDITAEELAIVYGFGCNNPVILGLTPTTLTFNDSWAATSFAPVINEDAGIDFIQNKQKYRFYTNPVNKTVSFQQLTPLDDGSFLIAAESLILQDNTIIEQSVENMFTELFRAQYVPYIDFAAYGDSVPLESRIRFVNMYYTGDSEPNKSDYFNLLHYYCYLEYYTYDFINSTMTLYYKNIATPNDYVVIVLDYTIAEYYTKDTLQDLMGTNDKYIILLNAYEITEAAVGTPPQIDKSLQKIISIRYGFTHTVGFLPQWGSEEILERSKIVFQWGEKNGHIGNYDEIFQNGYDAGYFNGQLEEQVKWQNTKSVGSTILNAAFEALDVKLFGIISILDLASIAIVLGLVFLIIKFARG